MWKMKWNLHPKQGKLLSVAVYTGQSLPATSGDQRVCSLGQAPLVALGNPSISFGATAAPEPISQWARRVVSLTVLERRYVPLIGVFIDGDTPSCPVRVGPLFDVEVWAVGSQVTDCRPDLACSQIKILGNASGLD